jgi:SAM-dependent methyltransferase
MKHLSYQSENIYSQFASLQLAESGIYYAAETTEKAEHPRDSAENNGPVECVGWEANRSEAEQCGNAESGNAAKQQAGSDAISYPEEGNEACFEVEDRSFWFRHRNACIAEMVRNFPPEGRGPIFDVGGGNGFVAKGLMDVGWDVVLVEPGPAGARNAKKRGLPHVICATTQSAGFQSGTVPAIGVFDVVEHIEEDLGFLRHLYDLLVPGGMLYLTVPAFQALWSQEDIDAGHFRRYSLSQMEQKLEQAGFESTYSTYIFQWLVAPVWLFRVLPYRLGLRGKNNNSPEKVQRDHVLKEGLVFKVIRNLLEREQGMIEAKERLPFGGSCMVAMRKL